MDRHPSMTVEPADGERSGPSLRSWRALLVEFGILAAGLMLYKFGRTFTRDAHDQALANTRWVVDVERALRMHTERGVQQWVLGNPGWIEVLNTYYVRVHFPATVALLVWVFARRPSAYRTVRNWFVGVTMTAVVVHMLFPLAPPRMTAGFVDTLRVYGPQVYTSDPRRSVANQFAAMPSLHFGWALMTAIVVLVLWRSRWRFLALAHPAITLLAIVATANHYWLDAMFAAVIAAVVGSVVLAHRRAQDQGREMVLAPLRPNPIDSTVTVGASRG